MEIKIPKKWFQPSKWKVFSEGIDSIGIDVKKKGKKFNKLIKGSGSRTLTSNLPIENLTNLIIGVVTMGIVFMVGSTILSTVKESISSSDAMAYNATSELTQSLLTSTQMFGPLVVIMVMLGSGLMLWVQRASVPVFFFVEFGVSLFLTILGVSSGLVFTISVLMCACYAWWYFTLDDSEVALEKF